MQGSYTREMNRRKQRALLVVADRLRRSGSVPLTWPFIHRSPKSSFLSLHELALAPLGQPFSPKSISLKVFLWTKELIVSLLRRMIESPQHLVDVLHHWLWTAKIDLRVWRNEI
jgi:hypothetical protein